MLEIQLPDVSGIELCRRIKSYGDLPIIVRTDLDDGETRAGLQLPRPLRLGNSVNA